MLNKRSIENFIKAGALDNLGGTRKQFMMIYIQIVDNVNQERIFDERQMSLFDFVDEDQKKEFEIQLPDVGEYEKETLLAFEKEVLGVYISGHPLDAYEEQWKKSVSATTLDFQLDEETNRTKVHDGDERNHRGHDRWEDDQAYEDKSNDGIYYRGRSARNGGSCRVPERL